MKIHSIKLPILFKFSKFDAITFYNFIFYRNEKAMKELKKHEEKHVEQYFKYPFTFLIRYIYYSIKYGYYNNPFEIEARKNNGGI